MRGRSSKRFLATGGKVLATFVFVLVLLCATSISAFAEDKQPVTSVTINLENTASSEPRLPSISCYGNGYYCDSYNWLNTDINPGVELDVEITLYVSNSIYVFSNPSITINGGTYMSTNYISNDRIVITVKSNPIRFTYPAPSSAKWDDNDWGKATWKRSEYDDCKYEVRYNGKTYTTSKTYYDLSSKIKDWSDSDDYFEVRVIPKNSVSEYVYASGYVRSNDLDWDNRYYYDDDYYSHNDSWYYDGPYCDNNNSSSGWKQHNTFWYYYKNGEMVTDDWVFTNDHWYFFNDNGKMVTGSQHINGKNYFFRFSGEMISNDWVQVNNKWYFFYSDGSMAINTWIYWKDKWYFVNNYGEMLTNTWFGSYYLGSDGAMCTNTWIGPYYTGPDGKVCNR